MSAGVGLPLTVVLLLANAFFVGAEFAVISARRSQIEPLAAAGRRAATTTLWAMEHVAIMLVTAQLGITVCSLGLGAVAEPVLADLLAGPLGAVGAPSVLAHALAVAVALTIVVYLHVVIGEMIPKNLTIAVPERAALVLVPPLVWLSRVLAPIARLLDSIAKAALRRAGVEPRTEVVAAFTAEEVRSIVIQSRREGTLADTQGLVSGALQFGERLVGDLSVPLSALVTISKGTTPAEVEKLVARTGFSRFPVVDGTGDLVGYLHIKDVLYADDHRRSLPVPAKRIRHLVSVASTDEVEDALAVMQRAGSHLARVVGPDSAPVGAVFLEDVIEELVGEVRDATRRESGQRG